MPSPSPPFAFPHAFDPQSAEVKRSLMSVNDKAMFLRLLGPGESGLNIGALRDDTVPTLIQAFPVLYKLETCLGEEWPYEAWTEDDLSQWHLPTLSGWVDHWREQPETDPKECISYLRGVASSTFDATRESSQWEDRALFHPDRAVVLAADLHSLDFVTEQTLQAVLANEWNGIDAAFEQAGTFYYLNWWTTA